MTLDSKVVYGKTYGSILHEASKFTDNKIVARLLQTDLYDINCQDCMKRSPIFYAVIKGDLKVV